MLLVFAAAMLFITMPSFAQLQHQPVPGRLNIKLSKELSNELGRASITKRRVGGKQVIRCGIDALDNIHARFGIKNLRRIFRDGGIYEERHRAYGLDRWYEIEMDTTQSLKDALSAYVSVSGIERVEFVYEKKIIGASNKNYGPIYLATPTGGGFGAEGPDDPLFPGQWHYRNQGQSGGTPGADIDLVDAWKLETGKPNVIVAVMDGGIQIDHPDLASNMWINQGETPANGIDDDGNGYVDDINGYNFGDDTGVITGDAHGTHVAGTVAATTNNGIGVAGIAGGSGHGDGVRLMSCAVFGAVNQGHFAESYVYAADMGAVISQNSWNYNYQYEQVVLDAIDYFIAEAGHNLSGDQDGPMYGGVVVFAAGNSDWDEPVFSYPAFYAPTVAVAATDHFDKKASYSNFGTWVDISAPGGDDPGLILSTLNRGRYGYFAGTSMACPHVSGIAALLVSRFGGAGYTPETLKTKLFESADNIKALNLQYPKKLGSGRANAKAALYAADARPPQGITDLSIDSITYTSLFVSWTSPLDSGDLPASAFDLRYSTDSITTENFSTAIKVVGVPPAELQGAPTTFIIEELLSDVRYYVALKSVDFSGNISALSNIVTAKTATPPRIVVSTNMVDVNLVTAQTVTVPVTISNAGGAPLTFSIAHNHLQPSSAQPDHGIISPQQNSQIELTISAENLLEGSYTDTLVITTNDPDRMGVFLTVNLSVTNNGTPVLRVSPSEITFNKTPLKLTAARRLFIRNAGSEILSINSISPTSHGFDVQPLSFSLNPFDTAVVDVHFTPDTVGIFSGMVKISTNDPLSPEMEVSVEGEGFDPYGGIAVSSEDLNATLSPDQSSIRKIWVHNNSNEEVPFSVNVKNRGFYNTAYYEGTTAQFARTYQTQLILPVAETSGKNREVLSSKFETASGHLKTTSPTSTFQYATTFESFAAPAIAFQEDWYGDAPPGMTISSLNPARGNKHIRCLGGNQSLYSPRVPIGTNEKSTVTMQINLDHMDHGFWQIVPVSLEEGLVVTRVILASDGSLSVLLQDEDEVKVQPVPVVLPNGYFELSVEVLRASSVFSIFINGDKVFNAQGFGKNITATVFFGSAAGQLDIDDIRMIDGPQGGVPYLSATPDHGTLTANDSVSVDLLFNTTDLRFGNYESIVEAVSESRASIVLPARLIVTGDASVAWASDVSEILVPTGKDTTIQVVVRNTGGQQIDYQTSVEYESVDSMWLAPNPVSSIIPVGEYQILNLEFHARHLLPGVYHSVLSLQSNAVKIDMPLSLSVTPPPQLVIDGNVRFSDDVSSASINLTNAGESPLYFRIDTHSAFRTFHGSAFTPSNSDPVHQGPMTIEAIENEAAYSDRGSFYGVDWDECFYCGILSDDGWVTGTNWAALSPYLYTTYLRGKSDGSNLPSMMFTPRVTPGSENVSSVSMKIDMTFSGNTTWQIIPQSLTDGKIVTRLQINPDQTFQVLKQDDNGEISFQLIPVQIPQGQFILSIDVDRGSSRFSIFFDDARVFTGKGFNRRMDQVSVLSLNESDKSFLLLNAFKIDGNNSLVLSYLEDDYGNYPSDDAGYFPLTSVTGSIAPGATVDREIIFSNSDLVPGTYGDSLRVATNDPDLPIIYLPVTAQVDRPYQPRADYVNPGKFWVTQDSFPASINQYDSVSVKLTLHNDSPFPRQLFFPNPVADAYYRAYTNGSQNFHWTDISESGTKLDLDDDDYTTLELPFVFAYGSDASKFISIGSNGVLALGNERVDDPNNVCFFNWNNDYVWNRIAVFWDDLLSDNSSSIEYMVDAEKLIVQYTDVLLYGTNKRNTFQVTLYKNGSIKFQYLNIHDVQSATVGLSLPGGYPWSLSCNEPIVKDSLAILFETPSASVGWNDSIGSFMYVVYPWIHYPHDESITVPAFTTRDVQVVLKPASAGSVYGNIHLWSYPIPYTTYEPEYYWVDSRSFIFPVQLKVIENPPPVLAPTSLTTLLEGTRSNLTISATDGNDSTVSITLKNAPAFVSLLSTNAKSATFTFMPTTTDIGTYAVEITATDPHGATDVDTLRFSVERFSISDFSLIDVTTGAVLFDFTESVTINRADPNFSRFAIIANTESHHIGSVKFKLDGPQINIDNTVPYQLKTGSLQNLAAGDHTLMAEPFTLPGGHGQRGVSKQVKVTLMNETYVVVDFSLIDQSSGKVLENFDQSVSLSKSRYDFDNLVIRANTSPATVGSVKFTINNKQVNIDNTNPYWLKTGALQALAAGVYPLSATPFAEQFGKGTRGIKKEVFITIEDAIASIVDFSLVNSRTGEVIQRFDQSITLNKSREDLDDLIIQANTTTPNPGSVKFKMNGVQVNIDNTNPYQILAHVLSSLPVGDNQFSAEPFAASGGHGEHGARKVATITVTDLPQVVDFSLINLTTGETIKHFINEVYLDAGQYDLRELTIAAHITSSLARSVKFKVNGVQRNIDNTIPFMLAGSTLASLPSGESRLLAEPYTETFGHGIRGIGLETSVYVSQPVQNASARQGGRDDQNLSSRFLQVYPVPVKSTLTVSFDNDNDVVYKVCLVSALGQPLFTTRTLSSNALEIDTDKIGMSSGVYYLHVINPHGYRQTRKVVKE